MIERARSGGGGQGAHGQARLHAIHPECLTCDVRHLAFCAGLEGKDLGSLERLRQNVQVQAGETVFAEQEPAGHVYNVTRGGLRIGRLLADGRRQLVNFAMPGDFVGLDSDGRYSASAEALTDSELCRFDRRDLDRLFTALPSLQRRLLELSRDALVEAQDRMVLLGRKSPAEKLASFLLELSARAKRQRRPASPVYLPMNRTDIADYLGLTIETVSRTFTRLRNERLIALPETHLVVLADPERLAELAAGDG